MTLRQQVFNAPGTWTWPGNVTHVDVFLVGGGGAAGTISIPAPAPSGGPTTDVRSGAGGGIRFEVGIPVSAPVPVTVGAGGSGSPTLGGDSSFGPTSVGGGASFLVTTAPPIGGGGTTGPGGFYGSPAGSGGRMSNSTASNDAGQVLAGVESFFDVGSYFDGYGSVGGGTTGLYGSYAANMGGGGCGISPNRSPVPNLDFTDPGTSGVVIVRWFE